MTDYLCNLVIPGAPKSGTSSLCALLSQHPEICMSTPKEPQFFSFDERFEKGASYHNRFFFHSSGQRRYYAEGSQCYFTHEWAIERIAESLNRPKVIISLRNPVDRVISHHNWNFRRAVETDSLENAVKERGEERAFLPLEGTPFYDPVGGHLAFSRYSRWVPLWRNTFGAENVLVVKFDDLVADPKLTANRCVEFLGLPPFTPQPEVRNATNETFRTIAPAPFRLASNLVPQSLKSSRFYKAARALLMDPITPRPNEVSLEMRRYLEKELAEDIRFMETIR